MRFALALLIVTLSSSLTAASRTEAAELQVGEVAVVIRDSEISVPGQSNLSVVRGTMLPVIAVESAGLLVSHTDVGTVQTDDVDSIAEAEKVFLTALENDANDVGARIALANIYRSQRYYDRAVEEYCIALKIEPNNADALRGRGMALTRALTDQSGMVDLRRSADIVKDDASTLYRRGYEYAHMGKVAMAFADYNEAIRIAPRYVDAYLARALLNSRHGKLDQASADFAEAVRLSPRDSQVYIIRGIHELTQGNREKAQADFEKAIDLNPQAHRAYERLARLLMTETDDEKQDPERVVMMAKKAVKLTDAQVPAYASTLSQAYACASNNTKSVEWRIYALRLAMAQEARLVNWHLDAQFEHRSLCCQGVEEAPERDPSEDRS